MPDLLKIGLIVNPVAGLGGPTGLKGTDGMVEEAIKKGAVSRVPDRVAQALGKLDHEKIEWLTLPADMGSDLLGKLSIAHKVTGSIGQPTSSGDTRTGVKSLESHSVDLILFAGGDGTARDVFDVHERCPAFIGIPCGVKMHSGVFATSPRAAGELLARLIAGEVLSVMDAEVRDIDEASFRDGIVKTRFYGELPVPDDLHYMQQTKIGGREVEELVIEDIAADFRQQLDSETLYIMGSGSTVAGILESMGLKATLLGVDAVKDGKVLCADASESELLSLLAQHRKVKVVITAISGQGHILGRGNQQISPDVIRRAGPHNIVIVASKSKLAALGQRPLLVDTGDPVLDDELRGLRIVLTGYEDRVFYKVA